MNEDIVKGQWMQLKGQVRQWWGKITDDDLEEIAGRKDACRARQARGWFR